ncbi:hypothetical protein FH603_3821 [Spirosoma sp. LMG 31447]|uniref:Uncharacterized protein n=1 Tax=Spirosoma utsteinense TaxID=2585773 RepID=A0ABR6WAV6_9BACT|nr:hypothetical protein [Spirosoma utsteinense]
MALIYAFFKPIRLSNPKNMVVPTLFILRATRTWMSLTNMNRVW